MTSPATVFLHRVLIQLLLALPICGQAAEFRVFSGGALSDASRQRVERLVAAGLERLAPMFPDAKRRPITVFAHPNVSSVPERVRGAIHDGTAGVALLQRDEIHLILDEARRSPPHDLRTVVDHELVHILLDQHVGRAASPHVSRWFHEGLAQVLSGGPYLGMSEDDLVLATRWGRLMRFSDLHDRFPHSKTRLQRAYAQSFSFVGFLHRALGLELLLEAAKKSVKDGGFRVGFYEVTRKALVLQEEKWKEYVLNRSGAALRFVFENCFAYVGLAAFVLLALAWIRRSRRDEQARAKLELEDEVIEEDPPGTPPAP